MINFFTKLTIEINFLLDSLATGGFIFQSILAIGKFLAFVAPSDIPPSIAEPDMRQYQRSP